MEKKETKKQSALNTNDENFNVGEYMCECCNPPFVLTLRYDLELKNSHPRFGICILRDPLPGVHEYNSSENKYELRESWTISEDGTQILVDGQKVGQLQSSQVTSLLNLADDDDDSFGGGMSPSPNEDIHVDTQRDDFYDNLQ